MLPFLPVRTTWKGGGEGVGGEGKYYFFWGQSFNV